MKKIVLIYAFVVVIFGSCTNLEDRFYDRLPADQFPENPEQLAVMTVPVYSPLKELLDWGGWWFCQELTTDEVVIPIRDTDWNDGGKWVALYKHEWTNTTEAVAGMWGRFYRGISEANRLIEMFEPSAGTPGGDLALAKLKVMRGFYYYLLIDNYGDVPYVSSFSNAPALPYKNSRDSIWHWIVRDIKPVIRNLEAGGSKYSPGKGMAYMLMAKLYLNAEQYIGTPHWDIAEKYCDSVINLGTYSLEANPLGPFVTNNQNSPEIIFAIP
ncbi:MAG TPA: RagB/SusD family nutrient uptake outer membrane protein, partial [Salinivirgaceae bacterium]|nr:RagB/SusD family nutrient uptake outer membrane protein [Salinivirgaceae bacterium]